MNGGAAVAPERGAGDTPARPVAKAWQRLVLVFCLLVAVQDGLYAWTGIRHARSW